MIINVQRNRSRTRFYYDFELLLNFAWASQYYCHSSIGDWGWVDLLDHNFMSKITNSFLGLLLRVLIEVNH